MAEAELGGLRHGFISERAGAGDDADFAGPVDVAGHNADFAFAGGNHAGAVRAHQAGAVAVGFEITFGFEHIQRGHAFGNHHHQFHA